MIALDVDHGSHGLFPHSAANLWFPVSLPVGVILFSDLSLVGGVQSSHNRMLITMEMLDVSAKPGMFLFHDGSGLWTSRRGWVLLQCDALALP